jgi:hypothetical protein
MATRPAARTTDLRRVDCTEPGRGPWRVIGRPERRCYQVRHQRTASKHTIYYGTRTERTREDAEEYAIALCALLNALKEKRI